MKILIASHAFYPSVGGIETVSSILAHEFINQSHEVKLITQTLATDTKSFPFEIVRQPKPQRLFNLMRWCDVFFQNNISLRTVWPLLLIHRPWIVAHQTWLTRVDGILSWQQYLKQFWLQFASSISISQSIADNISMPSVIIGNPYDEDIFYEIPEVARNKELVFLGRLVHDKGVDLLISALGKLKIQGLTPQLTIIGTGPEENFLRSLANDVGVFTQVNFVGTQMGIELVQLLNSHQILVVPSRWREPFGIVALEGIACGCVVVGSEEGGLKDAIGSCGVTFPNGDVQALAQKLADLLLNQSQLATYKSQAEIHLSRYKKTAVAKAYLQVFDEATKRFQPL